MGSIYLDGNVRIKGNLSQVFNFECDLAVHDHARDCIYEEARTVILKKRIILEMSIGGLSASKMRVIQEKMVYSGMGY